MAKNWCAVNLPVPSEGELMTQWYSVDTEDHATVAPPAFPATNLSSIENTLQETSEHLLVCNHKDCMMVTHATGRCKDHYWHDQVVAYDACTEVRTRVIASWFICFDSS